MNKILIEAYIKEFWILKETYFQLIFKETWKSAIQEFCNPVEQIYHALLKLKLGFACNMHDLQDQAQHHWTALPSCSLTFIQVLKGKYNIIRISIRSFFSIFMLNIWDWYFWSSYNIP